MLPYWTEKVRCLIGSCTYDSMFEIKLDPTSAEGASGNILHDAAYTNEVAGTGVIFS